MLKTGVSKGTASGSTAVGIQVAGRTKTSTTKEIVLKSGDEHQSFFKARGWLASSAVKDSRKSARKLQRKMQGLEVAAASIWMPQTKAPVTKVIRIQTQCGPLQQLVQKL